jgi:hypothetical protein
MNNHFYSVLVRDRSLISVTDPTHFWLFFQRSGSQPSSFMVPFLFQFSCLHPHHPHSPQKANQKDSFSTILFLLVENALHS